MPGDSNVCSKVWPALSTRSPLSKEPVSATTLWGPLFPVHSQTTVVLGLAVEKVLVAILSR